MNFSNEVPITCLESYGRGIDGYAARKAVFYLFITLAIWNIICNTWCAIVSVVNVHLRKPTWIFKASMAAKDVMCSIAMILYIIWISLKEKTSTTFYSEGFLNVMEFSFNVIYIMCIISSFVHILLVTFDRHQVISRPFRYHTNELLPSSLSCVLMGCGWVFSFVIALSFTSQSLETAEHEGSLDYVGALFLIYRAPIVQKWLLGVGLSLVYLVNVGLLASAFSIEWSRAKKRKAQLISGVGELEPVRSRNNSLSQAAGRRKKNSGAQESGNNSENDANEFLLTAGGLGSTRSKKDECNEEATILTPVHYRPSLRRRIRDTWSLYSAAICFLTFTVMAAIPFFTIVFINAPQEVPMDGNAIDRTRPFSYCVGLTFVEFLIMLQGFAYVTVYVLIDDVFRPHFLKPFRKLQCKKNDGNRKRAQQIIEHGANNETNRTEA